ncbi:MAG: hypothetical protein ACI3T9_05450 [Romboutsia timonensis]
MILARNSRTFDRLKKMILKGAYDKDELILDMTDFLELGTLTESEFAELLELIEQNSPATVYRTSINENGVIISDNTYLLLQKQIIKKVYTVETIEQMVTDFKITGAITREQFKVLINAIDENYFPVIEDEFLKEEI